jgi:hypothetical protein
MRRIPALALNRTPGGTAARQVQQKSSKARQKVVRIYAQ